MFISDHLPANQSIKVPSSYLAHLPWPAWIFDLQSLSFLDVNDAAVREYGYSRSQFLQMTVMDIRPGSEVPKIIRRTMSQEQPGPSRDEPWLHRRRDGHLFHARITSCYVQVCERPAELVIAIPGAEEAEPGPQNQKDGKAQSPLRRFFG